MTDRAELRARLVGAQLRGLVGDHLAVDDLPDTSAHPAGAALVHRGAAWVLVDGAADRSLGGALAWAIRQDATSLNIVASSDTGLLARRAEAFAIPISVWFPEGRDLLAAPPERLPAPAAPDPAHLELGDVIVRAGADLNVEHGIVAGEVHGLEVCRVVDEPTTGAITEMNDVPDAARRPASDGVLLEVGVGANDREAFRLIHGDVPTADALRAVVESVRRQRVSDGVQHPLARMARERMLRWTLEQEPASIGLTSVRPSHPPVPRPSLRASVPCVASGTSPDGREVTVVCSTGVDLELAPFVADVQAMPAVDPSGIIVVLPERDRIPLTRDLLGLLRVPVAVRGVG